MSLGSGRAYTRFPALQSCSHGEHIKCSPARAELAINLVYARPLPRGSHPKCGAKLRMPSFLSAQARRKFDTGRSSLPDAVDAKRTPTPHRDRKVPGTARAPAATYELYREFRTNRRPLNVASVVSRTVRAGKFICGRWRPGQRRGPHEHDYSVMFGSASTSNGEISPRSNLRRATSAIMAALSVQADKGGTVTRMP